MYDLTVHATIRRIISFYYRIGIWRNREENFYSKWARWSIFILIQCPLVPASAVGAFESDNMEEAMHLAAEVMQCSILCIKMMYMLFKKTDILIFINEICTFPVRDRDEFRLANEKINKLITFGKLFVGTSVVAGFLLMSIPLMSSTKTLPVSISVPFDWDKRSNFGFYSLYVYIMLAVVLNIISSLHTILIWYLMINCSIQYRNLGTLFKKCGSSRQKSGILDDYKVNTESESLSDFLGDLKASIGIHRSIYGKVNRFKEFFSNLFMAQMLTTGSCICGSIYVLAFSTSADPIVPAFNILLLVYTTFDIFMIMYFANEIQLESSRLSYCFFESNWMEEPHLGKYITIVMEGLRQPQELIICKIYPMNLETFTSILKFSYSTFNILKSFE